MVAADHPSSVQCSHNDYSSDSYTVIVDIVYQSEYKYQ